MPGEGYKNEPDPHQLVGKDSPDRSVKVVDNMLNLKTISAGLVAGAAFASAQCTIPTTPLSDDIPSHFRIQVQNASRPEVHNKYMNLFEAGGGDQHLFIGPVGEPTYDFTLVDGVVFNVRKNIRLVIGGEVSS